MKTQNLPPHINFDDNVILFDGVCKLCNGWSRFILKYDINHIFKLASVQSEKGKDILKYLGMPTEHFDTMLYLQGEKVYKKSTAFFNIVRLLPFPISLLSVFRIIPLPIRDWMYDRVALNRYYLFGMYEQCVLPEEKHRNRFLE